MSKDKNKFGFPAWAGKTLIILLGLILAPELLLQIGSFWVWYDDHVDDSRTVLCIADYQASYPAELEKALKQNEKSRSKWKVIAEMKKGLTIQEASKIIHYYASRKKPLLIYLTLGQTEILRDLYNVRTKRTVWNDSYQWRFRSRLLLRFLRGSLSNWKAIFATERFHKIEDPSVKQPSGKKVQSDPKSKGNQSGGDRPLADRVVTSKKLDQIQREVEKVVFDAQRATSVVLVPGTELKSPQNRMLGKVARRTRAMLLGFPLKSERADLNDNHDPNFVTDQVLTNFQMVLKNNQLN